MKYVKYMGFIIVVLSFLLLNVSVVDADIGDVREVEFDLKWGEDGIFEGENIMVPRIETQFGREKATSTSKYLIIGRSVLTHAKKTIFTGRKAANSD